VDVGAELAVAPAVLPLPRTRNSPAPHHVPLHSPDRARALVVPDRVAPVYWVPSPRLGCGTAHPDQPPARPRAPPPHPPRLPPADPNDSTLLRPIVSMVGGTPRLQFPVIPNRRYQVEASADFTTWGNAGSSFIVPTANPTYLWTDPLPATSLRFYRVRISMP